MHFGNMMMLLRRHGGPMGNISSVSHDQASVEVMDILSSRVKSLVDADSVWRHRLEGIRGASVHMSQLVKQVSHDEMHFWFLSVLSFF